MDDSISRRLLTLSSNEIRSLPVSFQALALDHIDVFGNPFESTPQEMSLSSGRLTMNVPTLLAVSAKCTIKFKLVISLYCWTSGFSFVFYSSLRYTEGDIPSTLITYLHESSTVCPCGKLCVDDGLPADGKINLLKVSGSVTGDKIVPMKMTLCSPACFQRFALKVIS